MDVLMLVWTGVATDTRVLREAGTLVAAGHRVHVIGREVPAGFRPPAGITVSSVGAPSVLRPSGTRTAPRPRRLPLPLRAARWALLPTHVASAQRSWARGVLELARPMRFDVVHAHDFSALPVGVRLATEHGVPYVYDTHELWLGRPRSGRPTPLRRRRERAEEARLGGAAAAVLTVSDGVADQLRADYGWPHVRVVRNTFPAGEPERATELPPLPDAPRGLVYAGRVAAYREIETIVAAARRLAPLPVTVVGPADETYLAALDRGPVTVLEPLPVDDVDTLLREAGLALVTHSDRWPNHRLALPNKLFHAVRAGVPVVATDVPELARVVSRHDLGVLYRPGDPESLTAAVRTAQERYRELVANVAAAAAELSWDRDAAVLTGVYAALADQTEAGCAS